jgi:hypothetical protein
MKCDDCANYRFRIEQIRPYIVLGDCTNYKPKEQEWKVGDYGIYQEKYIGKLNQYNGAWIIETLNNHDIILNTISLKPLRLADLRKITPKDWTVEVDGFKYRAFETMDRNIILTCNYKGNGYTIEPDLLRDVVKSFCRLANIPIMPVVLSHGLYDYPE